MDTNPGHLIEFYKGFNGTCGECGEEECFAAADGRPASEDDMVAITHEMQNHGQAGANGASTLWSLAREAERRGYKIALEWDYAEPFPHDWVSVLRQNAGVKPILLQHAKGRNLHDVETGAADEATLDYHFTAVLNKQADGYVDNDGDNPQVLSRYQIYSLGVLTDSTVCGLLMLEPKENPVATGVPANWHDDGTTLTAPNNVPVVRGFRDKVLAGWEADNYPLAPEAEVNSLEPGNPSMGAGVRQDFRRTSLGWSAAHPVYVIWVGQDVRALEAEVAALQAKVAQLEATPPTTVFPPEFKGIFTEVLNQSATSYQLYLQASDALKKYGN